jgi:hypothetical protein
VKIRARLAYGVVLAAEIPDAPMFRALNVEKILEMVGNYARPTLQQALTAALGKLSALGVRVQFSDARFDLVPEPEPVKEARS